MKGKKVTDSAACDEYNSKYLDKYKINGTEANQFFIGLDHRYIDVDSFHAAFDKELNKCNLLYLFNDSGLLKNKSTYGEIKNYLNNKNEVFYALLKFWVAQYNNLYPTKSKISCDIKKELSK